MSRRHAVGAALGAAALVAGLAPDGALAHGIAGRQDLPFSPIVFAWSAVGVLVISFVALALLWPSPRLEGREERRAFGVPRAVEALLGALGVALFAVVVWAGLDGTQSTPANLAPTTIYVLFWVGVPLVSLLFGDVFRAINPWRAIGRAVGWTAQRVAPSRLPEPLPYPERLGRWPAALGLLAFAWVELVFADGQDPSTLAILAIVYLAVQLVGMALYGVEPWTRAGDAFGVYFRLVGLISPLHWRDRALYLRRPLAGVATLVPMAGTVALLAVMIGTTSFDGFSEGPIWTDAAVEMQGWFVDLGLSAERALELASTIGMVLVVLLVLGLYRLGVAGMRTVDERLDTNALSRGFVHSLVPIALAYVLAHYFSLLAYQGQATAYLASDPLGRGWDLFGTAESAIDYTVVSANGIWYVQVGALVIGHVAGLLLAHDRALRLFSDAREATRSQYWMLTVMITFTSLGLWLLSSASQ